MIRSTRRAQLAGAAAVPAGALAAACAAPGAAPERKTLAPASLTYTTWWLPPLMSGVATEKAVQAFQGQFPSVTVRVEPLSDPGGEADGEGADDGRRGGAAGHQPAPAPVPRGLRLPGAAARARRPPAARPARRPGGLHPGAAGAGHLAGEAVGPPGRGLVPDHLLQPGHLRPGGAVAPERELDLGRLARSGEADRPAARRLRARLPRLRHRRRGDVEPLVWAWGGEILSKSERECLLNRPPAPEAIQWRADLTNRHAVVPTAQDLAEVKDGVRGLFQQGRLGMFTTGNWALTDVQAGAQMPWSVAPLPQGRAGRVTLGSGAIYGAFKEGRQPDAAWELLADLVMGDAARVMATESSMLPSLKSMIRPEALPHYRPEWLTVVQQVIGGARPTALQPPPLHRAQSGLHRPADARLARSEAGQRRHRRDRAAGHPDAGLTRRAPTRASRQRTPTE